MEFIILIIAVTTIGWLANNWIRAKHGYDLEDEFGGKTKRADAAAAERLEARIAELADLVEAQGDRLKVLERIVTEPGHGVAKEIEALRDEGSGVPLDMTHKEHG